MLTLPASLTLAEHAAYPDDQRWWRYHLVPMTPRLMRRADGLPSFHFLRYRHSDAYLAAHPDAPAGGGVVRVEVDLDPTPDQLSALRAALQPEVNARWNALRRGTPNERAMAADGGRQQPPEIELVRATYQSATLELVSSGDSLLVTAVASPTAADLQASSLTAELTCTPAGASLFQALLEEEAALPIQLRLRLSLLARMPDVTVRVVVDARRLHTHVTAIIAGTPGHRLLRSEVGPQLLQRSALEQSTTVRIEIDAGSATVEPAMLESLREQAWTRLEDTVWDSLFVQSSDGAAHLGTVDLSRLHLSWEDRQRDVVSWQFAPSASLDVPLAAMPAAERMTTLLLDQEALQRDVTVEVRLHAPLGTELSQVEVELKHLDRTDRLLFTTSGSQTWTAPRSASAPSFAWRTRAHHLTRGPLPWSAWTPASTTSLPIYLASQANRRLRLLGVWPASPPVDRVEIMFSTTVGTPPPPAHLDNGHRERELLLPDPPPTGWRATWVLSDGTRWPGPWVPLDADTDLLIGAPPADRCALTFVPTGPGWDQIDLAILDVDHDTDEPTPACRQTLRLDASSHALTVDLALPRGAPQRLRHRLLARFRDGTTVLRPWQPSDERVAALHLPAAAGRSLTLLAHALDLQAAPRTVVEVRSSSGEVRQETFTALEDRTLHWSVAPSDLTLWVTHHPDGRAPTTLPPVNWDGEAWLIPPYRPHRSTVRLVGTLLDAAVVREVTVEFELHGAEGELSAARLTVTPGQTSSVTVLHDRPVVEVRTRRAWLLLTSDPTVEQPWASATSTTVVLPPRP